MGADVSRLSQTWATSPTHINRALYNDMRKLRARSRDLARNNEYANKFLALVANNVVGHAGFGLQVQALRPDGSIDQIDSTLCERAFAEWAGRGCEITGRYSFADLQRVFIRTVACDGEVLVRRHDTGPFRYQIELLDPALLDERLNQTLANGAKVRMGVEYNALHQPIAYYLARTDTADPTQWEYGSSASYERVPADQIWHCFVPEAIWQLRGKPWMAPAIFRMQMLAGYEEAAMVAARLGAAYGGFFETPDGDAASLADAETTNAEGGTDLLMDVEPGTFRGLPPGVKPFSFDPKYPHEMFADFVKMSLRGVSSGFGVAYNDLANDLENVNYSSIRSGTLDVREQWKTLQDWMIGAFLRPLYSEWLPRALTSGRLPLPFSKRAKFDAAIWQGRRWDWVDPVKDVDSNVTAVQNGLKSYSQIIREQGRDPDEVWAELEQDRARLASMGMSLDERNRPLGDSSAETQT